MATLIALKTAILDRLQLLSFIECQASWKLEILGTLSTSIRYCFFVFWFDHFIDSMLERKLIINLLEILYSIDVFHALLLRENKILFGLDCEITIDGNEINWTSLDVALLTKQPTQRRRSSKMFALSSNFLPSDILLITLIRGLIRW